jgi:hypothetical protein
LLDVEGKSKSCLAESKRIRRAVFGRRCEKWLEQALLAVLFRLEEKVIDRDQMSSCKDSL